jgi:Cu+-exporting ATPase
MICYTSLIGGTRFRGEDKEVEAMERDPVCDMEVDPKTAPKSEFQGQTYYFCSLGCKQAFDENPKEYADKARAIGKRH